jgi:hypothetical protein
VTSAPAVPAQHVTGDTVFRFEFATIAIESFKKAAPVAPELAGKGIVLTNLR